MSCWGRVRLGASSPIVIVHVFVCPTRIVPLQPIAEVCEYPGRPLSDTLNDPWLRVTVVPGDAAPAKDAEGCTFVPVTVIVNAEAVAAPPLSFTTCLITVSWGATSSFVIVHVFVSPTRMVPLQPT